MDDTAGQADSVMRRGEFGSFAILDDELTPRGVPLPGASWGGVVAPFALTFDGYVTRTAPELGEWANGHGRAFAGSGALDPALALPDLRALLFFEQRRYHHFGEAPDAEARRYIDALLVAIRRAVVAHQAVLAEANPPAEWDPDDDWLRERYLQMREEQAARQAAGLPEPPSRPRPVPPDGPGWQPGRSIPLASIAPGMRVFHAFIGEGEVLAVPLGPGAGEIRVKWARFPEPAWTIPQVLLVELDD